MRIRIYQMREDCGARHLLFRGRDSFQKEYGDRIPAEMYRKVFDDDLAVDDPEQVFAMFNISHPEGYTGRSLSVSDVVELADDGEFYFCDHCCFTAVSFSEKK